ncbi:hypothetical protein DL96DRAFT_1616219 [Flagelloscypha sp. PMI_526]|nr:hypothetical protein DL96DRAFT_1616219 [Flagelloscypha sp. PMI_526]
MEWTCFNVDLTNTLNTMSTTADQVRQSAAVHQTLLEQLAPLQGTPSCLACQQVYLADLKILLKKLGGEIRQLTWNTAKEREEHESIQKSFARKYAARIAGKKEEFIEAQVKEEREYIEALEKETRMKAEIETLKSLIHDGEETLQTLSPLAAEHDRIEKELNDLYAKIFGGTTQEFPQEDTLENNLSSSQTSFNSAVTLYENEKRANALLVTVRKNLLQCKDYMEEALGASTFHLGHKERKALYDAHGMAHAARTTLAQAYTCSPQVNPLVLLNMILPEGSRLVYENPFADFTFTQWIRGSCASIEEHVKAIEEQQHQSSERVVAAKAAFDSAKAQLETNREELMSYRRNIFEQVSRGSQR